MKPLLEKKEKIINKKKMKVNTIISDKYEENYLYITSNSIF